jgi:hypothetical protein
VGVAISCSAECATGASAGHSILCVLLYARCRGCAPQVVYKPRCSLATLDVAAVLVSRCLRVPNQSTTANCPCARVQCTQWVGRMRLGVPPSLSCGSYYALLLCSAAKQVPVTCARCSTLHRQCPASNKGLGSGKSSSAVLPCMASCHARSHQALNQQAFEVELFWRALAAQERGYANSIRSQRLWLVQPHWHVRSHIDFSSGSSCHSSDLLSRSSGIPNVSWVTDLSWIRGLFLLVPQWLGLSEAAAVWCSAYGACLEQHSYRHTFAC